MNIGRRILGCTAERIDDTVMFTIVWTNITAIPIMKPSLTVDVTAIAGHKLIA